MGPEQLMQPQTQDGPIHLRGRRAVVPLRDRKRRCGGVAGCFDNYTESFDAVWSDVLPRVPN